MNDDDSGGCTSRAPYALQVLGNSMEPEFQDGAVIVVDPDFPSTHGAYVIVDYEGETYLRQFIVRENARFLCALNGDYPEIPLLNAFLIRGVVTQQARRRKLGVMRARHYVQEKTDQSVEVSFSTRI